MDLNLIRADLEKYFFNIPVSCPYGLPHRAIYRQALLGLLPEPLMERFMAAGFRRSGNSLYTMACQDCRACVPIRLDPTAFRPNRSQRRAGGHNRDLAIETGPLEGNEEKLALCQRFLSERYPGRGNSADEYYFGFFANAVTTTFEIRYRLAGRLVGVAVVDAGSSWLNAVYFFFDPDERQRSLGTFNILTLIDFCRQHGIAHLYLGYWIDAVRAMRYKADFKPHQLLVDDRWQTMDRRRPAAMTAKEHLYDG